MLPEYTQFLDQLEIAWNESGEVDLHEFLSARFGQAEFGPEAPDSLREFISEAVQIDMERRQISSPPVRVFSIAEYVRLFPLLNQHDLQKRLNQFEVELAERSGRETLSTGRVMQSGPNINDAERIPSGTTLGPYKVVREIGRGGMGAVYEAIHSHLHKHVALKLISRAIADDAAAVARFRREMKAAGLVDHVNVVRAMDAGEIDGKLYLVTEFVSGIDLGKLVKEKGPQSVAVTLSIIRQAAEALDAAHKAGIVHRDLKPSNLMMTESGDVKLLDLGLARVANDSAGDTTDSGSIFGTPDYMAPEQWDDVRNVDGRADLYSLGCTMYFLLTGQAPYSGDQYRSAPSKMKAHIGAPIPQLPPTVSDLAGMVQALLDRLMAKSPSDRLPTAGDVLREIQRFSGEQSSCLPVGPSLHSPESSQRKKPSESVKRADSSKRWLLLVLTVVLVACGLAIFIWSFGNDNDNRIVNKHRGGETDESSQFTVPASVERNAESRPTEFQTSDAATEPRNSAAGSEPVPKNTPQTELTGNAYRRFAQTALRLGSPIVVTYGADGAGGLLNKPEELPERDFYIKGNWDCFAETSGHWQDADFQQLRGIHYWNNLNIAEQKISDEALQVLTEQEFLTDLFRVSARQLSALQNPLQAYSLVVSDDLNQAALRLPECMRNQPQLRDLHLARCTDERLKLVSQNVNLRRLSVPIHEVTLEGLKELENLPSLCRLELTGIPQFFDIEEVWPTIAKLKSLQTLWMHSVPCRRDSLLELQADCPNLIIIHPEIPAEEPDIAALKQLKEYGAKVYTVPELNDDGSDSLLYIDGIDFSNVDPKRIRPGDLHQLFLFRNGLHGVTWSNPDYAVVDLDELTFAMSSHPALESVVLHISASKYSESTFQNLSLLTNLQQLQMFLTNNESMSFSGLHHLKNCRQLNELNLGGGTFGDDEFRAIADCEYLSQLGVNSRKSMSAEHISHLKRLKWLHCLTLRGLRWRSEHLVAFSGMENLRLLILGTVADIPIEDKQELQKMLPKCLIVNNETISFPEDAK